MDGFVLGGWFLRGGEEGKRANCGYLWSGWSGWECCRLMNSCFVWRSGLGARLEGPLFDSKYQYK